MSVKRGWLDYPLFSGMETLTYTCTVAGRAGDERAVVVEEARCQWTDGLLGDRETAELAQVRAQRCGNTRPADRCAGTAHTCRRLEADLDKQTEAACARVGGGKGEREETRKRSKSMRDHVKPFYVCV